MKDPQLYSHISAAYELSFAARYGVGATNGLISRPGVNLTHYHGANYRSEFMGNRDYFGDMSVCPVEWPEWGGGALPPAGLVINIGREGLGHRLAVYVSTGPGNKLWRACGQSSSPGNPEPEKNKWRA